MRFDKVWTADRLSVLNRNLPCKEDVKRWPHLRNTGVALEFPKPDLMKAVEILIGPPLLTFKTDRLDLRGLDPGKRDVKGSLA